MIYLGFFILCVVAVGMAMFSLDARRRALLLACLCLGVAYLVELNGVRNHDWNYANIDSVLRVTGIPIEILFGYFTAAFLLVMMVTYIPRVSTERRRREVMQYLCLGTGVVLLACAYALRSIPVVVGWSFLGMYGLSVARDRTIPMAVGVGAFLADWLVEGMLTARMEYYSNGWDPNIGLTFMMAGMFISGVLTHESLTIGNVPLDRTREEPKLARPAGTVTSDGWSSTVVRSEGTDRKH